MHIQALKYWSVMGIVRPISEIDQCSEETPGSRYWCPTELKGCPRVSKNTGLDCLEA